MVECIKERGQSRLVECSDIKEMMGRRRPTPPSPDGARIEVHGTSTTSTT